MKSIVLAGILVTGSVGAQNAGWDSFKRKGDDLAQRGHYAAAAEQFEAALHQAERAGVTDIRA